MREQGLPLSEKERQRRRKLKWQGELRVWLEVAFVIVPFLLIPWLLIEILNRIGTGDFGRRLVYAGIAIGAGILCYILVVLVIIFGKKRLSLPMGLALVFGISIVIWASIFGSWALITVLIPRPANSRHDDRVLLPILVMGLMSLLLYRLLTRYSRAQARQDPVPAALAMLGIILTSNDELDAVANERGQVPRCLYVRREDTHHVYPRNDLPANLKAQLRALPAEAAYCDEAAIRRVLTEDGPLEVSWRRVYTFPDHREWMPIADANRLLIKKNNLLDQCGSGEEVARREVFAVVENGHVLSYCRSTRPMTDEHPIAAMPYVYTQPEQRRQGYASRVLRAWAQHYQHRGAILFFSHSTDDEACAALARSMDLRPCFDFVAFY